MGSIFEWITIDRAADAIGVSKRQIYKYIAKGQLTTRKESRHLSVNRKDVKSLIDARKKGVTRAVNGLTVARMDVELQDLRKKMDTVMRILDIRHEPLDLDVDELVGLHDMATHNLKIPWSPHEEIMWSDVFVRLRSEDLEKIATTYEHPWRPFLGLAKAMYNHPHNQDLKSILSAGVGNIERIGFSWSQKMEGTEAKDINHMVSKDDVLVRRIGRKLAHQQNPEPSKE